MPLTYYGERSVAYPAIFGAVSAPATYYFGLQVAANYPGASQAVTTGAYIIPTNFDTFSTSGAGNNRIFIATSTGTTSASAEPTWTSVTAGGSVVDGTVTWQDVAATSQWLSTTTPTFNEVSFTSTGYARVSYTNNATNFPAPTGSNPTTGTNANIITFPASTASWGNIAAVSIHTAATSGSVVAFAYLSKHLAVSSSGITPSIPASTGLTISIA